MNLLPSFAPLSGQYLSPENARVMVRYYQRRIAETQPCDHAWFMERIAELERISDPERAYEGWTE